MTTTMFIDKDRARQLLDFKDMRWGGLGATDIDGYIEYHGLAHIFWDLKYNKGSMSLGQQSAYEQLTDSLSSTGKPTIFIIARHYTKDTEDIVDSATAVVSKYRLDGEWHRTSRPVTLRSLVGMFLDMVDEEAEREHINLTGEGKM